MTIARQKDEYNLYKINSYHGSCKMSSLGPSLWNSLPVEQQNNRDIGDFLNVRKSCFWDKLNKSS